MLVAQAAPAVSDEVDDLLLDLKYGTDKVRWDAVRVLGEIGDPKAVDPLIEVLKNKDETYEVRGSAAIALGEIGDPRAVDPLIEALSYEDAGWAEDNWVVRKDKSEYALTVRKSAAIALGEIGDPRGVDPLIEALSYVDYSHVVIYSAEALGKIGDPRAVDPLIKTLKDLINDPNKISGEDHMISYAASALGKIGDPKAVDTLIEILERNSADYGYIAPFSAAIALGDIGDPKAVDPLIEALQDGGLPVREWAAWALGEIGDARAVEPLNYVASRDEVELIRKTAAEALKKIEVHGVTEVPEIIEETETPEETRGVPEARIATAFDYPVGTPRAQGGPGYVTQTRDDGDGWYNAQDWADYNSDYGGYHPGEDWNSEQGGSSDVGAPVYAIADGIVSAITTKVAGNGIAIRHTLPSGESIYSVYIHIDIQPDLNIGSEVHVGDRIGSIANIASSGMSPHLHFEIRTSPVIPQDWYPNDNGIGYYPSMGRLRSDGFTVDPSDFIDGHRGGGETEAVGRIEIHVVAEAPEITEEAEAPKESPLPVSIGAISIIFAVLFMRSSRDQS